jgi:hypothetical protein
MSVNIKNLIPAKQLEATQVTQYTANGVKARIDKCSVVNSTGSNATFSVNIVSLAGSPSASNLVITSKAVAPNESYPCPELIGQVLEVGSMVSTIAGTATALTLRMSGVEIT